ncbi:adenylyl-sulfate kinase [Arthrobacter sp. S39]|uniref:adenylyl-sulfate kinase n=1 Tax=Arthrobacter sp. S39 TaxID=2509720 RepID=UPI0010371374|nr:adenylyl-sulfate kinase [Arthrobacter sp. S39]TAP39581.1 adenylyl-sulfate kinase [Arthrobacter sp. S39]
MSTTIWLTGLPSAGKTTLAHEIANALIINGRPAYILDGDRLRQSLNSDLSFSPKDRNESVRRAGEVSLMMVEAGIVCIVAMVSPYRDARDEVRRRHESAGVRFHEVFVDTPLEVCVHRDAKGLYAEARSGRISNLTGINDTYQRPLNADLVLTAQHGPPKAQAGLIQSLWFPEPCFKVDRPDLIGQESSLGSN